MHDFLEKHKKFHQQYFRDEPELYKTLQSGQNPKALVIACSDSRADPALITNAQPGDLFVVRNVANIVPSFAAKVHSVASALEYGIQYLKIPDIIVLGHSQCGGIKALLNNEVQSSNCIQDWIDHAKPAKARTLKHSTPDTAQERCEQENILLSLENLLSYPWIHARVTAKTLHLHGWHFNITDGSLSHYRPDVAKFRRTF